MRAFSSMMDGLTGCSSTSGLGGSTSACLSAVSARRVVAGDGSLIHLFRELGEFEGQAETPQFQNFARRAVNFDSDQKGRMSTRAATAGALPYEIRTKQSHRRRAGP